MHYHQHCVNAAPDSEGSRESQAYRDTGKTQESGSRICWEASLSDCLTWHSRWHEGKYFLILSPWHSLCVFNFLSDTWSAMAWCIKSECLDRLERCIPGWKTLQHPAVGPKGKSHSWQKHPSVKWVKWFYIACVSSISSFVLRSLQSCDNMWNVNLCGKNG